MDRIRASAQKRRRAPRFWMVLVEPDPGRKSTHLVLAARRPRSKWWTVSCMGAAKRCRASECVHARLVLEQLEPGIRSRARLVAR